MATRKHSLVAGPNRQLSTSELTKEQHIAKYEKLRCSVKGCNGLRHAVQCRGYVDVTRCKKHVLWELQGAASLLFTTQLITHKQRERIHARLQARFG